MARQILSQLDALMSEIARLKAKGESPVGLIWNVFVEDLGTAAPEGPAPCAPFDGEMVAGTLSRIECSGQGLILHITSSGKQVRLFTPDLARVKFLSCTSEGNEQVDCKVFNPAPEVVAYYRKAAGPKPKYDGEPIAVEFVGK